MIERLDIGTRHLEEDANLKLFDRTKGRLVPTEAGLRLYEEVEKCFSGVRQIDRAIDALHRQQHEHLSIGIIPALSGFTTLTLKRFRERHPNVLVSVHIRDSLLVPEWIGNRRADIGLTSERIDVSYLQSQTLMRQEMVCVLPPGHRLAASEIIDISDLAPFFTATS